MQSMGAPIPGLDFDILAPSSFLLLVVRLTMPMVIRFSTDNRALDELLRMTDVQQ